MVFIVAWSCLISLSKSVATRTEATCPRSRVRLPPVHPTRPPPIRPDHEWETVHIRRASDGAPVLDIATGDANHYQLTCETDDTVLMRLGLSPRPPRPRPPRR